MNIKSKFTFLSAIFLIAASLVAQEKKEEPAKNWFNLDAKDDKVNGVSTEKAYEYLKGRESKTVIVAIIDFTTFTERGRNVSLLENCRICSSREGPIGKNEISPAKLEYLKKLASLDSICFLIETEPAVTAGSQAVS